jgi:deoxyribodipyrimidine photo-lyase
MSRDFERRPRPDLAARRPSPRRSAALAAAAGRPALIVYLFDEESPGLRPLGGAAKWWLAQLLNSLSRALAAIGGRLGIVRGAGASAIPAVAAASGAREVFWTRRYGGAEIEIDKATMRALRTLGVKATSFKGQLLREPREVLNADGEAFRVFSPFGGALVRSDSFRGRLRRRRGSPPPTGRTRDQSGSASANSSLLRRSQIGRADSPRAGRPARSARRRVCVAS